MSAPTARTALPGSGSSVAGQGTLFQAAGTFDEPVAPSVRAELERALADYRAGQTDGPEQSAQQAIAVLQPLVGASSEAGPRDADIAVTLALAFALLGRCRRRGGHAELARAAFDQAVELFAQWLPLASSPRGQDFAMYGVALEGVDRDLDALEMFERAVRQNDDSDGELHRLLGLAYEQRGRLDEAIDCLRKAIELGPDDVRDLEALGRVLEASGQAAEATRAYVSAGHARAIAGRNDMSLELFQRALALTPDDPEGLVFLAEALRVSSRAEESLAAFNRVPPSVSVVDPSWLHASKGAVLYDLGHFDEALVELNATLELAPDYPFALAYKGLALRGQGQFDACTQELRRALELDPNLAWVRFELGETFRQASDPAEALPELDQALTLDPSNDQWLAVRGDVLQMLGRPQDALDALEPVIARYPDYPFALRALASALIDLRRLDEAIQALTASITIEPDISYGHFRLGEALSLLGRNRDALASFRRAVELAPDDDGALTSTAATLYALGEDQEAALILGRALAIDPDGLPALVLAAAIASWAPAGAAASRAGFVDADPRARLADALVQSGRRQEASAALDAAAAHEPTSIFTMLACAGALQRLGRADDAVGVLEYAATLEPQAPGPLSALAALLIGLDRSEQAVGAYERALVLRPEDPNLLTGLARALRLAGQIADALETIDRAIALAPEFAGAHAEKAECLLLLGRPEDALTSFDRSLELRLDPEVVASKASALASLDRFADALSLLDRALQDAAATWEVYSVKAWILSVIGRHGDAVEPAERSIELQPDRYWPRYLRSWALEQLGRWVEAHSSYEAALARNEESIWSRRGVADTLMMLNRGKEASAEYRALVQAIDRSRGNGETLALLGWCELRLGQLGSKPEPVEAIENPRAHYDAALACLAGAVSAGAEQPSTQLDIALTLMCAGRHRKALLEYERAAVGFSHIHPLRRYSHLLVAHNDLSQAIGLLPALGEVSEAQASLQLLLNKARELETLGRADLPAA